MTDPILTEIPTIEEIDAWTFQDVWERMQRHARALGPGRRLPSYYPRLLLEKANPHIFKPSTASRNTPKD